MAADAAFSGADAAGISEVPETFIQAIPVAFLFSVVWRLRRCIAAVEFEAVIAGVAPGRWSAPSPCPGWTAADVAGHVIGDLRATEVVPRGRYEQRADHDPGSVAGDDPLAAWRAARADMMAALDSGALARLVRGPWGRMPLGEILEQGAMEFVVHTWDVAQATGQVAVLDPGLVHAALGPARRFAPLTRSSGLAGPECAVPEDADDLIRLLAIFGRRNTGG